MAAVSLAMQGDCHNDLIFSLLDTSWYAKSILNHSTALSPPSVESSGTSAGMESETILTSAERDIAGRRASILNHSTALSPPSVESSGTSAGMESETILTSAERHIAGRRASSPGECSTSQSFIHGNNSCGRRYSINDLEIRRVFDSFDKNGDGKICEEELRRYMSCCGKDLSDVEASCMISCVDINKDGVVDFEEFLSLYRTHGSGDATGEDDEGARKDEEEAMLGAFRVFDRNHDGFISARELQTVLLDLGMAEGESLNNCEKIIRNVDRDGDGQCDILEFQEMMSSQRF